MLPFTTALLLLLAALHYVDGYTQCQQLEFGQTYHFHLNISSFKSVCYNLDSSLEDEALRVFTSCEDAPAHHPVLVTVRQSAGVTSWPVPFVESGYAYSSIHRMLCPLLNIDNTPGNCSVHIDLSTTSSHSLNFTLRTSIVSPYKLQLGKPEELVASPASPSYMLFEYPVDVSKFKVKVSSADQTKNICAIASVQHTYCPIVELLDNPKDRGKYQTLRSIAAFNVEKHSRRSRFEFFYVVLLVFPHNGRHDDCSYVDYGFTETITLNRTTHNFNPVLYVDALSRVKHVIVTVEPSMPDLEYLLAMGIMVGVLAAFYIIICGWITFVEYWKCKAHPILAALEKTYTEELAPFDQVDGQDIQQQVTRPLLNTKSGLRERRTKVTKPGAEDSHTRPSTDDVDGPEERLDQSPSKGSSVRPTLLAVLAGLHWRNMANKHDKDGAGLPRASAHKRSLRKSMSQNKVRPPEAHSGPPIPVPLLRPSSPDSESVDQVESDSDGESSGSEQIEYKHDCTTFPVCVLMSEVGEIDERQGAFDKYPIYLLVVSIFYVLPVFQLLVTYRYIMATGNEDTCYHNFLCAHPLEVRGIKLTAFNNIFSNIAFFLLGVLLILIGFRRRHLYNCYILVNERRPREERIGIPQQFGIYHTIGIAMMGQAVLSSAYHMCPRRENFTFDATFIYFQFCLGIQKLLHSRVPEWEPRLHKSMLLFSTLLVAVVSGVDNYKSTIFWVAFSVCYSAVTVFFAANVYYRWQITNWEAFKRLIAFYQTEGLFPPRHKPKFVLFVITILLNLALALFGLVSRPSKFASYMLYIILTNFIMYLLYYIVTKIVMKEHEVQRPPKARVYAGLAVATWAAAVYFFANDPTEWNDSPALSRDINRDCVLFGFFDNHDVWHFLSGFATFFSSMLVLTLDDKQEFSRRDQLMTF